MPGQTIQADVISIEAVTDYVNIVKLKPQSQASFLAGQYLQIVLGEEDKRIFSIASSPKDELIELHIGAGPNDAYPQGALDHMAAKKSNSESVTLDIGLGNAHLQDNLQRPIILMAGGTGFSYTKSIADFLAQTAPNHKVIMYWGVKNKTALYAEQAMQEWSNTSPNFDYIPVVEQADDSWQGKTGYVHQAVMADINDLESYDIYLAGPFKMAGIARDDFIAQGAVKEQMFADAFAYI
jgi:aquacobalamin reductase/NAD(P)H-flavin reductase